MRSVFRLYLKQQVSKAQVWPQLQCSEIIVKAADLVMWVILKVRGGRGWRLVLELELHSLTPNCDIKMSRRSRKKRIVTTYFEVELSAYCTQQRSPKS